MEINLKFHCEKCNLYFNYKSFLEKHLLSNKHINGERKERKDKGIIKEIEKKKHKCKDCEYESININHLKSHILNNHSTIEEREKGFKFYCKKCNFGSFTKSCYNKHLDTLNHIK